MGDLFGTGRFALPPLYVAVGVLLVAGRSTGREPVRAGFGLGFVLWAAAGLAAVAGGAPGIGAPASELAGAGGWFGAALCDPLRAGLGTAGAAVVLVALLGCALLVLTGVSLRTAVAGSASAAGFSWRHLTGAARAIRSVGELEVRADRGPLGAGAGEGALGVASCGVGIGELDQGHEELHRGDGRDADPGPHAEGEAHDPDRVAGSEDADSADSGDLARGGSDRSVTEAKARAGARQLELDLGLPKGQWRLPHVGMLARSHAQEIDRRETALAGQALVDALGAHGVETNLVGYTVGPTVTRYELELGPGVKVARVTSLAKDIAYAMASPDVRILAPIPGKSAIGIEVPNRRRQLVTVGDVLSSEDARKATHPLEVALGRDIAGRAVMVNIADMPHILISGATGAGKSSCINSLLTSILARSTPEQVRLILVDPKRVELGQYNGLPHLLTQVVVDPKKAANALSWAVAEMERRYDLLAEVGMRDITGYNLAIDRGELGDSEQLPAEDDVDGDGDGDDLDDHLDDHLEDMDEDLGEDGGGAPSRHAGSIRVAASGTLLGHPEDEEAPARYPGVDAAAQGAAPQGAEPNGFARQADESRSMSVPARVAEVRRAVEPEATRHSRLPFVLVVVDELNDLMMVAARDVEESVCRIAQMARAVGIHLVLATQRPSVDVITGVIKANIPSRLAFSVSSLADSRVILDQPGAERLIGKGDMLLLTASSSVPRRIQGAWVTEEEVRAVAAHWRRQSRPEYVAGVAGGDTEGQSQAGVPGDDDEYLPQAMELVVRSQLGSTSMLQRKLRVGFSRAGRLMDLLERRGVVGPSEGSKARAVLMTVEELEQLQSRSE